MKPDFNCLYFLESQQYTVLEIKRRGLPADADISAVYQWLVITNTDKHIHQLTFRSMDSSGEIQERFFDQGYLKFNSQTGTYIEKFNSGQHQLVNRTGEPLPTEIIKIICSYLTTGC